MYIEINTALNFSFSLILGDKCQLITLSAIDVIKNDLDIPQEIFHVNNTMCKPTGRNRSCTIGHREFTFFTVMNPSSVINSTWTFYHQNAPKLSLQIVSTSPPRVLNVNKTTEASPALMSEVVPAGSAVFIHCLWDNGGRPEVQPQQIFLNSNKTIEPILNTRNLTVYLLQNVSCDDAGMVKCSTEGNNKTAALLVACPPTFGHTKWLNLLSQLNSLPSDVPVKMPTSHITSCTLQSHGSQTYRERNCARDISIYGDPPFLRLNLSLLRFGTTDVADVWELRIANEYGSDSLFINASFDKNFSRTKMEDVEKKTCYEKLFLVVGGILAIEIFILTLLLGLLCFNIKYNNAREIVDPKINHKNTEQIK